MPLRRRATHDERVYVSVMLNRKMVELFDDASANSWRKLFSWMDDDQSGKVGYSELEDMVRSELQVSPEEIPEEQLMAIWTALDEENKGVIRQNKFNDFMRIGSHTVQGGEPWIDMFAIKADEHYTKQLAESQKPVKVKRNYEDRFFAQSPPATNAQEAATRVYNRGGILMRSDPFVKAVSRNGDAFATTAFHG